MTTQPPTATLHHLESSQSLRILWALEELNERYGTEYDLKVYKRQAKANPEMLEISPLGFAPILTIPIDPKQPPTKDNRIVKVESRLILDYIVSTYDRDGMWTPSPEDQERDEFFQEFGQNTMNQRIGFVLAFEVVPQQIPLYLFPIKAFFWLAFKPIGSFFKSTYLPRIFQYCEDALSDDKPWFSGAKMGKADILMTFPMDMARHRGYLDGVKYPRLKKWHDACRSRPAYQRALKKGGRYNLVDFMGGPDYIEN